MSLALSGAGSRQSGAPQGLLLSGACYQEVAPDNKCHCRYQELAPDNQVHLGIGACYQELAPDNHQKHGIFGQAV